MAVRSRSPNTDRPFTCTGLGDRIHTVTVGWCYGPPVTLHLTKDKWQGGQFGNKPQSWAEIIGLFPANTIRLQVHNVHGLSEREWVQYLQAQGHDARPYWYSDHPAKQEQAERIDIAPYLTDIPRLHAQQQDIELPRAYVTAQWDANGAARRVANPGRIEQGYGRAGYTILRVGGEAEDSRLRWSLPHIAYAMSRAAYHVGVDSAFMHLAQLYMEAERIHLYNTQANPSHHVRRLLDRGGRLNVYA